MIFSGGNMAVVVERHLRRRDLPRIRGILLFYPLLQLVNFRLASYRTFLPYRIISILREQTLTQVTNFYVNTTFAEDELLNNRHLSWDDYGHFYARLHLNMSQNDIDDIHAHQFVSQMSHPDTKLLFNENISPLLANDDIIRDSPATLIVACQYDILLSDAQLYYQRLQQLHVQHVYFRQYSIFHGVMTFVDFPVAFSEAFDIIYDSAQFVVNRTMFDETFLVD
jgi:arylacetamide deacetylase-like 3/4